MEGEAQDAIKIAWTAVRSVLISSKVSRPCCLLYYLLRARLCCGTFSSARFCEGERRPRAVKSPRLRPSWLCLILLSMHTFSCTSINYTRRAPACEHRQTMASSCRHELDVLQLSVHIVSQRMIAE